MIQQGMVRRANFSFLYAGLRLLVEMRDMSAVRVIGNGQIGWRNLVRGVMGRCLISIAR